MEQQETYLTLDEEHELLLQGYSYDKNGDLVKNDLVIHNLFQGGAKKGKSSILAPTVRLHIPDLPEPLHREVKAAAAAAGKTLKEWVTEALREKLIK